MDIPKHVRIIKSSNKGKSLFANRDIKKGEIVLSCEYEYIKSGADASTYSLQVAEDKFIDGDDFVVSDFLNHSCNANLKVDLKRMNFIALKNIRNGEELTYNYLTTEYDLMVDNLNFKCKCNSKNCLCHIKGFKYLTKAQKLKLKTMLSPYLKSKL